MKKLLLLLILMIVSAVSGQVNHTDTLKLTCSTDPDNTKQWVVNGIDILGATDSVLRVPLDSAYYSTNKEIYCRISNGSTSKNIGSWTVGKSGNKKSINRKRN